MGSLLAGLQDFIIYGKPRAPLALQLGAEMARAGQPCHAVMRPRLVEEGVCHVTNMLADAWRSFDEAMLCGCQCCLLCLRRSGVLPKDLQVLPKVWAPFGTLMEDIGNCADSGREYEDLDDDVCSWESSWEGESESEEY